VAQVCVVGAGYVGLTTASCLAQLGHTVVGIDVDPIKVDRLNNGEIPIVEEGLEAITQQMLKAKRLVFQHGYSDSIKVTEFIFLCVPTPQDEDGSADLTYIREAATSLLPYLASGSIIVNKSTVPVGSTLVVEEIVRREDVFVVSNPEFLREGSAVHDFLNPDRIVVGSSDKQAAQRVADLYQSINAQVIICDPASAETIKYAANAFLATKLSFANAIAALCEHVGANIDDVMDGIGQDKRIGNQFLKPGPGWGGSCFPKDTRALVKIAESAGYDFELLRGVIDFNEIQFDRIVDKVRKAVGGTLTGKNIAVLGLTFKAHTNDLRDSPALRIVEQLKLQGATINAYDPTVANPLPQTNFCKTAIDACASADAILIATEWPEFALLNPTEIGNVVRSKHMIDARNILEADLWRGAGFSYQGVGR
jgi:UDPglucose 6-dehydrogenase